LKITTFIFKYRLQNQKQAFILGTMGQRHVTFRKYLLYIQEPVGFEWRTSRFLYFQKFH